MKTLALIMMAAANAIAGVDNQDFYATRAQQIFKEEDIRELQKAYEKGDDTAFFTWKGFLSGRPLYIEIHGENLQLIQGKKKIYMSLLQAPALPGADRDTHALDDKGPRLFVKSTKAPEHSLVCIESLGPDSYTRPRPYMEVYLITAPFGDARLYRLSGINASCRGVEQASHGALLAPVWNIDKTRKPNVIINYFSLAQSNFSATNFRITGTIVDGYAQKYKFDSND